MAINYYEPKILRGIIKRTLAPRMFFRTRFFGNQVLFPTESVSFEFKEARRRLAPYVSARIGSKAIGREGYELKTFTPPLVAPERPITNDTLAQKMLGESLFNSGVTPEDRAATIAAQDLLDLQDAIYRREEFMCARAKQDGELIIKGTGVNYKVDYGFGGIINIALSDVWSPTYDILGQLDSLSENMRQNGINPDMMIVGSKAANALLKNEDIMKKLDMKNVELGLISPRSLEPGMRYIGRLVTPQLTIEIYSYEEWYEDDEDLDANGNPKLKPIVDPETVILQSSTETNSMLYGAITLLDGNDEFVTHMDSYVPNSWATKKPPQKFLSISSRPLPMPHDLKSWIVLKNVVTGI